ncbi:MAG: 3-isopropylmalate dehydratase small subunit [Mariprofundaceae bacterium]|nr:3-isopropylmalate dehydratase small subunit [Mariprofundaceae bacterium]
MMQKFNTHQGLVAPLDRANIDTDAIIPKQFLKSIKRTGYGPYLFDEWRYMDIGEPDMDCSNRPLKKDFFLNQARYQEASILLTRDNFACGSSREHAVWALLDYGFRAIIAPSFADIFYSNCFKNGILPICLTTNEITSLFESVNTHQGFALRIDLPKQSISLDDGQTLSFTIDTFRKHCLINGLDDIGLTLQQTDAIHCYEQKQKKISPWLFSDVLGLE